MLLAVCIKSRTAHSADRLQIEARARLLLRVVEHATMPRPKSAPGTALGRPLGSTARPVEVLFAFAFESHHAVQAP